MTDYRGVSGDKAAYWIDSVASAIIPASTAKTKLSGNHAYNSNTDYLVPGDARSIVAVRPKVDLLTPTAAQAVMETLKIESADLHLGDYEVFANPIDSALGTTVTQFQDSAPWYPANFVCGGGEGVQFYGTAQVANTAVSYMSCDVLLSDTPKARVDNICPTFSNNIDYDQPVSGKVTGINYGGGPTATGTAAASVASDTGVQISTPQKLIKALYGMLVGTTPAASKPATGTFTANEGQFVLNPQRWQAEPITGFLGTTVAGTLAHISRSEGLNVRLKSPARPIGSFQLDVALTTAGTFEVGYLYQDSPAV